MVFASEQRTRMNSSKTRKKDKPEILYVSFLFIFLCVFLRRPFDLRLLITSAQSLILKQPFCVKVQSIKHFIFGILHFAS